MKRIFFLIVFISAISFGSLKAQDRAVRVNIPSFLLGNFNADLSYMVSDNFSVHIQGQVKPFDYKLPLPIKLFYLNDKNVGWSKLFDFSMIDHTINYTLQPGIRYWIKGVYNRGFFFGANAIASVYKLGGDKIDKSYRKGYALGGALSSGYSYELSKLFNIEFEVGVGVYYNKYNNFLGDENNGNIFAGKLSDVRVLPSRFAISLVYLF